MFGYVFENASENIFMYVKKKNHLNTKFKFARALHSRGGLQSLEWWLWRCWVGELDQEQEKRGKVFKGGLWWSQDGG